jgi:hypothetical protein
MKDPGSGVIVRFPGKKTRGNNQKSFRYSKTSAFAFIDRTYSEIPLVGASPNTLHLSICIAFLMLIDVSGFA